MLRAIGGCLFALTLSTTACIEFHRHYEAPADPARASYEPHYEHFLGAGAVEALGNPLSIAYGESRIVDFTDPGDVFFLKFKGHAGDQIEILMREVDHSGVDPVVALLDHQFRNYAFALDLDGDLVAHINFTLNIDGTHYIAADTYRAEGLGEAEIVLSCSNCGNTLPDPVCESGSIRGRVCAPNGEEWLANASVSVETGDCNGKPVTRQTVTDADGLFQLDQVPTGAQTVRIEKGSFVTELAVGIAANQILDKSHDQDGLCFKPDAAKIAVVGGDYDHVENILAGLGIGFDFYAGSVFGSLSGLDLSALELWGLGGLPPEGLANLFVDAGGLDKLFEAGVLEQYDVVFLNCGSQMGDVAFVAEHTDRLRAFVENGGSIYASDWSYATAEVLYPEAIDFFALDDMDPRASKVGTTDPIAARLKSAEWIESTAMDQFTIESMLMDWVPMASLGTGTELLIEGDFLTGACEPGVVTCASDGLTGQATGLPLTARFHRGQGQILFTTFHYESVDDETVNKLIKQVVYAL